MHDLAEGATSVMKTLVIWQMGLSAAKSANLRPRIQIPLGAPSEVPCDKRWPGGLVGGSIITNTGRDPSLFAPYRVRFPGPDLAVRLSSPAS